MFSSSPRLIAAYRVFHRLPTPRHPPDALILLVSRKKLPSIPIQLYKSRPVRVRQAQRLVHIRVTILSLACCQSRLGQEYVWGGGAGRNRTDDLLLAKQMLSQLSYSPNRMNSQRRLLQGPVTPLIRWWAWKDLNFRPHAYQACALTT